MKYKKGYLKSSILDSNFIENCRLDAQMLIRYYVMLNLPISIISDNYLAHCISLSPKFGHYMHDIINYSFVCFIDDNGAYSKMLIMPKIFIYEM